ncbi:MAG: dihydrolipoamide acetyltransferase family protein, partial [Balneolaceae bacterium]
DAESGSGKQAVADEAEEKDPEAEEKDPEAEPAVTEPAPSDTSAAGEHFEVVMPEMGESVMEGTIIEWSKSVGDTVEVDEPLLEIATDKVDTEVPSPEAGTLSEILVEAGETIQVGQTIAIIQTGNAAAAAAKSEPKKAPASKSKSDTAASNGAKKKEPVPVSEGVKRTSGDGRFYSPLVRSIAKEEGITQDELDQIEGSGKDGRVSKEDILSYLEQRSASGSSKATETARPAEAKPAGGSSRGKITAGELNVHRPSENVEIIKMDRMRKTIAEHMVRSKQTSAHVSTFAEVDVTDLVNWREKNKAGFQEKAGVKLTFTPIFIEAIIQAMQEFPLINSSVEGDEIHLKKDINFGLAVALGEGGKGGLIVPVIKQAQEKNLVGLAKMVAEVAEKARNRDLKPDDLVGGTVTLTNYGSVGNLMGTPIINQPQVAILGTGVISKRPVVLETEAGDVIAIRHMMYLSMSYDHRIIDGAHGGAFVSRIKELLENFDPGRPV